MNRRIGILGALLVCVMLAACSNSVKNYGSVSLNTGSIARYITNVNAQDVYDFDADIELTTEEELELYNLMLNGVWLNVEVKTLGDAEKSAEQKITYQDMLEKRPDLSLEIKDIPVGSVIDLSAAVAMVCTQEYKDGLAQIMEKAFKRYYCKDGEEELPEDIQNLLELSVRSMFMSLGIDLKYEGKTDQPITIKEGKNSATILMYQTDGFYAGGGIQMDLEDDKPLELLVNEFMPDNDINIQLADQNYRIVKVSYISDSGATEIPEGIEGVNVGYGNDDPIFNICFNDGTYQSVDVKVNSTYEDEYSLYHLFQYGHIYIVARNSKTGLYKTAEFYGY